MAFTGQTIDNPVSGEQITFLQTAADTAGELLEFELALSPDGHVPGAHLHPEQEERFHVLEGNVTRKGMPKPLHLALIVRRFAREVRAPFPPAWMVQGLMAPLAALASRRGHGERYATA